MFVVGLTGGIGSGKSAVAQLFANRGIAVVDADAIAHELTAPGGAAMPALRRAFGPDIVREDGALNRAAMRTHAFANPEARQHLEALLHPMIRAESERRLLAATSPYAIFEVPLLIESGDYRARCDRILVVDCEEATQVARVQARNGLDEAAVHAIMAAQLPRATRVAAADDIIANDGTLPELEDQVEKLHRHYLEVALMKVKANH